MMIVKLLLLALGVVLTFIPVAQEVYFFSEATDSTYYDQGIVDVLNLGESSFEHTYPPGAPQFNDKVPASTKAYKGNTSLKYNYTSAENGNWQVAIYRNDWTSVDLSEMDTFSFFLFSESELSAEALPLIGFRTANLNGTEDINSALYPLANYNSDVPAAEWVQLSFPLEVILKDLVNSDHNFSETKGVVFNQSVGDGSSGLIYIDEISVYKTMDTIPVVNDLVATGYDSHVELSWAYPIEQVSYHIYASRNGGENYILLAETEDPFFIDFVAESSGNTSVLYKVTVNIREQESEPVEASAALKNFTDDELLDMVQQYSFRYFWEGAHQKSGMALERSNGDAATIASGATGMGLMAMIVAHERGYEPAEEIRNRIISILNFLDTCERHHGAWSHWYDAESGKTLPFSSDDDGGDIVETSFVAAALIALKNYFTESDQESTTIRETANRLWQEIDWNWYRNGQNVLFWHWSPNIGFEKNMQVSGWNETLITYIMAASSPTMGIEAEVYHQGFARNGEIVEPRSFYGYEVALAPDWGGPLFWIHFSHLGINPNGLTDAYADYWQECVNTALIHIAYAEDNPLNHPNYGSDNWGLTASDDPDGYTAHQPIYNDNGTIAPTAALASMPYTPAQSLKTLKYFYRKRGDQLFGKYGFYDAFNDRYDWVQQAYLGIDQGPIIVMIENHRSGLLWKLVMRDTDVQVGLNKLGFTYQTVSVSTPVVETNPFMVYPNPAKNYVTIDLAGNQQDQFKRIVIYTSGGTIVKVQDTGTDHDEIHLNTDGLIDGLYLLHLIGDQKTFTAWFVIKN